MFGSNYAPYHCMRRAPTHVSASPPYAHQELSGLPEARVAGDDADGGCGYNGAIPPATYKFRLYSGKKIELRANNLYTLDGQLCRGPYTGDDYCDVSRRRVADFFIMLVLMMMVVVVVLVVVPVFVCSSCAASCSSPRDMCLRGLCRELRCLRFRS